MAGPGINLEIAAKNRTRGAFKQVERDTQSLSQRFTALKTRVTGAVGALGGVTAALYAANRAYRESVDRLDELAKQSRAVRIEPATLQAYQRLADLGGVSARSINVAFRTLTRGIGEADRGIATYRDAFEILGITLRDGNGELRKTDEIFNELLEVLSKANTTQKEQGASANLLGRDYLRLASAFQEAIRDGRSMADLIEDVINPATNANAFAAEGAADRATELGQAIEDLTDAVVGPTTAIGKFFTGLVEQARDAVRELNKLANESPLEEMERELADYIERYGEGEEAPYWTQRSIQAQREAIALLKDEVAVRETLAERERLLETDEGAYRRGELGIALLGGVSTEDLREQVRVYDELKEKRQEVAEVATEVQTTDEDNKGTTQEKLNLVQQIVAQEKQRLEDIKLLEEFIENEKDASVELLAVMNARLQALRGGVVPAQREELDVVGQAIEQERIRLATIETINHALRTRKDLSEAVRDILIAQRDALVGVADAIEITEPGTDIADALEPQFQRLENVLANSIQQGMAQGVAQGASSFLELFSRLILTNIAQSLASTVTQGLAGRVGGGFLSNLLSGQPLFGGVQPRDRGGPVFPGSAYLVGESGPELFSPRVPGRILPGAGGGGVTIQQTLIGDVDGATRRSMRKQAAQQADIIRASERERRLGRA